MENTVDGIVYDVQYLCIKIIKHFYDNVIIYRALFQKLIKQNNLLVVIISI